MTHLRILSACKPARLHAVAKSITRKRWRYYVECWASGLSQQRENLRDLNEGAGPAMDEKQRNGILYFAFLPDKMDIELLESVYFDTSMILGNSVQSFFSLSPVPIFPCFSQSCKICLLTNCQYNFT